MENNNYWALPFIALFLYGIYDGWMTRKTIKKNRDIPFIGSSSTLIPRFILNLLFAAKGADIIERGYRKFKDKAFQLVRNDGHVILLPLEVLDELATLPTTVASPNRALEHDLLGHLTGVNLILESRAHHTIVQRRLTPRLGLMIPRLEREIHEACNESLPKSQEWVEFQPYKALSRVSARIAAQAIVPPEFSHHKRWLEISVEYTENLFKTVIITRVFPSWMQSFICCLLPSFWAGQRYMRDAKRLLGPRILELLLMSDEGTREVQPSESDSNILNWLVDTVKGGDRNADTIAHVEVLLALAAVHTTLLRMVNVLYDVIASGLAAELQSEIEEVASRSEAWSKSSYDSLYKLDSVLSESQRMSPPTTLGMKRIFLVEYTFMNGLHVPKGTYAAMPIYAIENDPAHTSNPEAFDGLGNYRLMLEHQVSDDGNGDEGRRFRFSTPSRTVLNFGYGRHACPGRHFASLILKILFTKLLTEYEFDFLPGSKRPNNLMVHEFLFTSPWQRMLIRKKEKAICPF
ncbi:putative cytochrome P450 [Daldinia caldariorum]|uniref:putative cytochrome P450 n=1 Tax=Daldinia caldariorum TaxID=326644 RepID=UPI002007F281|nr:putative cytochrome P450 [Daldinia caldariorum]KAI1465431.1 putative cytochrome P450 [Daldinia caldariorum]